MRIDMAFGGNPLVWLHLQADYDLAQAQAGAQTLQVEHLDAVEPDPVAGG